MDTPLPSIPEEQGGRMPGFISDSPLARELISIGDEAIATEDDAKLRAYFREDYVFHGPGADLGFDELRAYFASLRAAFSDLRFFREQIIVDGNYLAARTTFSGDFTGALYLLAHRSSRAHRARPRVGSDRYVQVPRRRSPGRGVGANRLPQLLDQARCDDHRDRHTGSALIDRPFDHGLRETVDDLASDDVVLGLILGSRGHLRGRL
jgi:hypothetical protein